MQRRENYLWLKCLSENFHPISHSHLDCGCLVSLSLFTTFRALILSPSTLERNKENSFGIWFSVSDRPWSKDDNGFQGWPHHHPAHHLSAGKVNSSFQDHIFWLYLRLGLFVNIFVCLFVCNLQCFFSLFFSSQQFPSNVFSLQAARRGRPEGSWPCGGEGGRPPPHHLPHRQGRFALPSWRLSF